MCPSFELCPATQDWLWIDGGLGAEKSFSAGITVHSKGVEQPQLCSKIPIPTFVSPKGKVGKGFPNCHRFDSPTPHDCSQYPANWNLVGQKWPCLFCYHTVITTIIEYFNTARKVSGKYQRNLNLTKSKAIYHVIPAQEVVLDSWGGNGVSPAERTE